MTRYQYKVLPAPERGQKAKGVKTPEGRFALAVETVMNDMAAQGWDYVRAETLPSEERQGLSGRTVIYRNLLVFRRPVVDDVEAYEPRLLDPPKDIPLLDPSKVPDQDSDTASADSAEIAPEDDAPKP